MIEASPFTYYLHGKREWKNPERTTNFTIEAFLLEVKDDRAGIPEPGREPTWFSPEDARRALAQGRPVIYGDEFRRVIDLAIERIHEKQRGPAASAPARV